jgi:hypothetical protein
LFLKACFFIFLGFLDIGVFETFGSTKFSPGLRNIPGALLIRLPYQIANIIVL